MKKYNETMGENIEKQQKYLYKENVVVSDFTKIYRSTFVFETTTGSKDLLL